MDRSRHFKLLAILSGIAISFPLALAIPQIEQRPWRAPNTMAAAAITTAAKPEPPAPDSSKTETPKTDPVAIKAPEKIDPPAIRPGDSLGRSGDEIVVCGQLFHTTAPVVLWMDPGGYDAYRTESRFVPFENSEWEKARQVRKELTTPSRFGLRAGVLTPEEIERVRGGGWDLTTLQQKVDQFVLHYDVAGTSRTCFKVLHDMRCLSVHFMLDLDGTLYQTLDLKERAWHATTSNTRSIGIEIANIGAYPSADDKVFERWYEKNEDGKVRLKIPANAALRTPDFLGIPARNELVEGVVQGRKLHQYDLTPQQYDSLIKLTAALCRIFPKITCDYPRDDAGTLITHKLPPEQLQKFQGVIGHYHIQTDKTDPGPALQWDRIIDGAKALR